MATCCTSMPPSSRHWKACCSSTSRTASTRPFRQSSTQLAAPYRAPTASATPAGRGVPAARTATMTRPTSSPWMRRRTPRAPALRRRRRACCKARVTARTVTLALAVPASLQLLDAHLDLGRVVLVLARARSRPRSRRAALEPQVCRASSEGTKRMRRRTRRQRAGATLLRRTLQSGRRLPTLVPARMPLWPRRSHLGLTRLAATATAQLAIPGRAAPVVLTLAPIAPVPTRDQMPQLLLLPSRQKATARRLDTLPVQRRPPASRRMWHPARQWQPRTRLPRLPAQSPAAEKPRKQRRRRPRAAAPAGRGP
mmetsp:Transcript_4844/g.14409  ORF Transcript_4844/g.14409 Transcript_4844/m.14409 type:complete len:311 (+) Transcript_4844:519-1451(+)